MKHHLQQVIGKKIPIAIRPFATPISGKASIPTKYDYIYVASNEAHKNYENLFKAWVYLKEQGQNPNLHCICPKESYRSLKNLAKDYIQTYKISLTLESDASHQQVLNTYKESRCLIYPSLSESFGLPLLEARALGLDIIASELDYVRDVVQPQESFDPKSPLSIGRAILRYENASKPLPIIQDSHTFLEMLYQNSTSNNETQKKIS